ncbi:hypothetical protein EV122DRAFT_285229 [Schizophyllum commune]
MRGSTPRKNGPTTPEPRPPAARTRPPLAADAEDCLFYLVASQLNGPLTYTVCSYRHHATFRFKFGANHQSTPNAPCLPRFRLVDGIGLLVVPGAFGCKPNDPARWTRLQTATGETGSTATFGLSSTTTASLRASPFASALNSPHVPRAEKARAFLGAFSRIWTAGGMREFHGWAMRRGQFLPDLGPLKARVAFLNAFFEKPDPPEACAWLSTILCRVQAAGGTTRAALGELCDEGGTPSPSSLFSMAQGPSDPLPHGEISLTPSRRRRAQAPSLIDAARVGYPRSGFLLDT